MEELKKMFLVGAFTLIAFTLVIAFIPFANWVYSSTFGAKMISSMEKQDTFEETDEQPFVNKIGDKIQVRKIVESVETEDVEERVHKMTLLYDDGISATLRVSSDYIFVDMQQQHIANVRIDKKAEKDYLVRIKNKVNEEISLYSSLELEYYQYELVLTSKTFGELSANMEEH